MMRRVQAVGCSHTILARHFHREQTPESNSSFNEAWVQISEGNATVRSAFKTGDDFIHAGVVEAQAGCWSMLKGGLSVDASGPAEFYFEVDAVVYLVDAFDKKRLAESKKELDALLSGESLANVPFLILGNKIDIPYAVLEEQLCYHLGLSNFTTGKGKVY